MTEPVDFIAAEADALDRRDYSTWLTMFADDARYWAPYQWDDPEPRSAMNLIYDDMPRLNDRVSRLFGGDLHAQDPPSHTSRLIGHLVPVTNDPYTPPSQFDTVVAAPFRMDESRRGVVTHYAGRLTYWLRRSESSWLISAKKVQLMGLDAPVGNLTFPL